VPLWATQTIASAVLFCSTSDFQRSQAEGGETTGSYLPQASDLSRMHTELEAVGPMGQRTRPPVPNSALHGRRPPIRRPTVAAAEPKEIAEFEGAIGPNGRRAFFGALDPDKSRSSSESGGVPNGFGGSSPRSQQERWRTLPCGTVAPPRLLAVSTIGPMRLGVLVESLAVGVTAAITRKSGGMGHLSTTLTCPSRCCRVRQDRMEWQIAATPTRDPRNQLLGW